MRQTILDIIDEMFAGQIRQDIRQSFTHADKHSLVKRKDKEGRRLSAYVGRLVRAGVRRPEIVAILKKYQQEAKCG